MGHLKLPQAASLNRGECSPVLGSQLFWDPIPQESVHLFWGPDNYDVGSILGAPAFWELFIRNPMILGSSRCSCFLGTLR